jgi:hypothetical protein
MALVQFLQRVLLLLVFSSLAISLPIQRRGDAESQAAGGPLLYFLAQGRGGRMYSVSPNGGPVRTIAENLRALPDGIAVDKAAGYIYYSLMGSATGAGTGSINRVRLDGSQVTKLVGNGKTGTPKQLIIVVEGGKKKLYWGDREGMKVMRSNIDGSDVEVVVDTARASCTGGKQCKWVVGVAVDKKNGFVYWSQKGGSSASHGSLHRAPLKIPAGQTAGTRKDIQTIQDNLTEPIDLRWVDGMGLFWTSRGTLPGGNSVTRMQMSPQVMAGSTQFPVRGEQLLGGLREGIGIAIDTVSKKMFITDLGGSIYSANLDGTGRKTIASGYGTATGIDFVP